MGDDVALETSDEFKGKVPDEVVGYAVPEVKEFASLVDAMCVDAEHAIRCNNKSAGRRARVALSDLNKKIIPLRKIILDAMKNNGK